MAVKRLLVFGPDPPGYFPGPAGTERVQSAAEVAMLQGRAEGGLQRAEVQLFQPFLPPVVVGEESVYVPPAWPGATGILVPLDSSQRRHETKALVRQREVGQGCEPLST